MTELICPSCGIEPALQDHEPGCPEPLRPRRRPAHDLGIDEVSFFIGESTGGEKAEIVATMVDGSTVPVILPNAPPGWRVQHIGGAPIFRCPCGVLVYGAPVHVHELPKIPLAMERAICRRRAMGGEPDGLELLRDLALAMGCELEADPDAGLCKAPISGGRFGSCRRAEGHDGDCSPKRDS